VIYDLRLASQACYVLVAPQETFAARIVVPIVDLKKQNIQQPTANIQHPVLEKRQRAAALQDASRGSGKDGRQVPPLQGLLTLGDDYPGLQPGLSHMGLSARSATDS